MFLIAARSSEIRKRELEILEVVARNGWHYFRSRVVNDTKPVDPALPLPQTLQQILLELGPTFIKLGQLLSTRPDLLAPSYIEALETLQNNVPAHPWEEIEPLLNESLGQAWQSVFAEVNSEAIAAGSLAQVHHGRLPDGQTVAIKIQRPNIRAVIEQDLEILALLAHRFSQDALGAAYDLPGLVEEFHTSLLGELDFRKEGRNTEQLRQNLAKSTLWKKGQVVVPQVHWAQSTETVLTLEWIEGVKLTQAELPESLRQEAAALVVQMMMQQILLDRFFHADPHPGNLLYVGDGTDVRLALIDCGMMALIDPRTQTILTDLLIGIVYEQPKRVAQATRELGFSRLKVDLRAIETAFDRLLRRYYTRPLAEINMTELLNEVLRIPRENKIQMPGTIGLFVKTMANTEGIARYLDPNFPFIEVARPIVEQAVRQRILGPHTLDDIAQSSLYLSRLLTQFPERLEILLDRFERSELGLTLLWPDQNRFQQTWREGMHRQSLAILAVGALVAGALLLGLGSLADSATTPALALIWSQCILAVGIGLGAWVVVINFLDRR